MKDLLKIVFLIVLTSGSLLAQNISFENITTQQGLSSAHVNQIIQDKKGFIWIATSNGLNRFDGVNFKVFQNDIDNSSSISGNNIRCILEDSEGNIWVGTVNNGLNKFDYKKGTFKRYLHKENNKNSISSNEILAVFEDSQKQIWVGTEYGLNLLDTESETFTQFLPNKDNPRSLQAKAVLSIGEDHRGWIWVGTWDGGLNLAVPTKDASQYEFRHFFKGDGVNDLKSNHIWKIFLDKEKRLWIGTYIGGMAVMLPNYELDIEKFTPYFQTFLEEQPNHPIPNNLVFGINQDSKGQIWAATVKGLGVFQPTIIQTQDNQVRYKLTNIQHFENNFFNVNSLINNEMRDVFIDNTGLVWCSTLGGISKFDKSNQRFEHFLQGNNKGQNIEVVSLIEYDDETMYIGSRGSLGLLEYNITQNTYQSYFNPADKPYEPLSEFISFFNAHPDTLWIGTRKGVIHFNPKTKQFKNYILRHPEGKDLTNLHVRKIIKDKHHRLWLATGSGLVLFDDKKGTFQFLEEDSEGKTFSNNDLNDMLIDGNKIWLATYGGLCQLKFLNNGQFSFNSYLNEVGNSKSIGSNRIMTLALLNNELWIGTENGLSKYNETTDDFENIVEQSGTKISGIVSMISSKDARLWLGTNQGLFSYLPKHNEIFYFNKKDGLRTGAFSLNATYKNQNDEIFMAGLNGYIKFKSEDIKPNQLVPPVYITDVKVYGQSEQSKGNVAELETFTLQPNENYFTIEFAALNYSQSSDNQYAYQLEGFHEDWVYCGHQKSVSFSNLDGGTYTFKVKGTNNDGIWNETPTILKIEVIPPFWEQVWFRVLTLLGSIALILGIYYYRIGQIERQKVQLENQVQLRTKEITSKNQEIERLVEELKKQNDDLEGLVEERTKEIEHSNLELKRSNEALEQFAYAASHDMQEPLRMISSFASIVSRKYKDKVDDKGQEYLGFIVDGTKRMSELIKSLLTYSRVGRSDAKFVQTDLNRVVHKKIADLALKIREKNAEVIIEELPKEVLCEPNQIGIVFYNLINNGLKFNRNPQPKIKISLAEETDTHWKFSVADNGIGIAEKNLKTIFEIFHRLHTHTEYEGNGIGLTLCKRIILRHNGAIDVCSKVGEGTTFYFTLAKQSKLMV